MSSVVASILKCELTDTASVFGVLLSNKLIEFFEFTPHTAVPTLVLNPNPHVPDIVSATFATIAFFSLAVTNFEFLRAEETSAVISF